jgi:hypothetical protein
MLVLVGTLGGCVETTQQKNARAQLQDDRLLASRSSIVVTRTDPNIAVLNVRTLRGPAGGAIAVTLRNDGGRPVSDLPLSVGVHTRGGHITYLNRQPELPYFQTHIAGIGGKAEATWVFSSTSPMPNGQVFVRVGAPAIPVDKAVWKLPAITSSLTSVRSRGRDRATVSAQIENRSEAPQDGLEVYAYALSGDRLVAAGTAPLDSLGSGATQAVQVSLVGKPGSSAVHLETPPTNLR